MRRPFVVALCALALPACGGSDADSPADAPAWRTLAPATLARTEVAAARAGRYVYVMGGFERESGVSTVATERYDIERDRWTRVADMPVALNHAAAASYRGDVYLLGGYRGRGELTDETNALHRYDPERDRWSRLPSAPTARGALAVGVIGHRLYAAGGATPQLGALKTLEIYDFARRRWHRGPDMGVAREHLAGAVARGRFYVLAGRAAGAGNFRVVEAFDPRGHRWSRVPEMRKARGGIAAATVGGEAGEAHAGDERRVKRWRSGQPRQARGRIVVVGGEEDAGTIREVELFDPATRRWRRLPDLPTPRHGLGAVARAGRVYVLEGGDKPGFAFTNTLEVLTLR